MGGIWWCFFPHLSARAWIEARSKNRCVIKDQGCCPTWTLGTFHYLTGPFSPSRRLLLPTQPLKRLDASANEKGVLWISWLLCMESVN